MTHPHSRRNARKQPAGVPSPAKLKGKVKKAVRRRPSVGGLKKKLLGRKPPGRRKSFSSVKKRLLSRDRRK